MQVNYQVQRGWYNYYASKLPVQRGWYNYLCNKLPSTKRMI